MEFKFSCKYFEIQFSGDPHFVEKQLEKYEPFVLNTLKKIEEDPKRFEQDPPPPQRQYTPPQDRQPQRNDYHQQRDHHNQRWDQNRRHQDGDRYRQGGNNRWDRPRGNDYGQGQGQRRDMNRPDHSRERHDHQPRLPRDPGGEDDGESSPQIQPPAELQPAPAPAFDPSAETQAPVMEDPETEREEDAPAGNEDAGPPESSPASGEFSGRRRIPKIRAEELIKQIDGARPRTHHDRVMVFGYYMENMGGGSDFTTAEIKRCYRAVNQDPGTNIEQVITHATRSGFVLRHDQGRTTRFKLSAKGKRYVEDGLKLT